MIPFVEVMGGIFCLQRTLHNKSYGVLMSSLSLEVFNSSLGWDRNLLEGLPAMFGSLGQRISKLSSGSRFSAPEDPIGSIISCFEKPTTP